MLKPRNIVRSVLLGWLLLVCASHASAAQLTLGSISNEPAAEIRLFSPVVRYLAKQLAPQGITKGKVVIAATMEDMAKLLKSGRVDFYMDSPMPSILVNRLAGSKMAMRRWKKGVAEYHSVVFTKNDGPLKSLSQLSGKLVGFEDPYSSSGHILPRIAMVQAGLNLVKLPGLRAKVPEGKTGYVFNDDDETTMMRVLLGRLDAGAMSEKDYKKFAKKDADKLRLLHETFPIPRHIVNLRGDFPKNLEKALRKAALGMEHDEKGKALLKAFQKTVRFDDVPPETLVRMKEITPTVLEIMDVNP